MKPAPFKYYAPTTVEEALARLAEHGWDAKAMAGGQSLIPMMNFRLAQPAVIVDLNRIHALSYIQPTRDGGIRVGAMTRQNQVERDPLVAKAAPMIHAAMPKIAYPQIRSRGTFGGSIAHADPSAELVAASVALEGQFVLRSPRGERQIAAQDFFVGLFTTVLEPDELLIEARLPPMPRRSGWAFHEVARRHHDFALAGVAARVALDRRGLCEQCRLAFFSVGDGPVQGLQASAALQGQEPTEAAIAEAATIAGDADVDPQSDINASAEYRRHLVKVLSRRALTEAVERAQGG
ncbi:MAG: xanthine dehydrogenase family protein subunit M [Anaerolineae bacterium]|jgi:CO/xanthine dehydrogenase FAD-binding subunit